MLKELHIIANGLLGLHGYPTSPLPTPPSEAVQATAATAPAPTAAHECASRSRQSGASHQRARALRNGGESKVS